jgi:hypothetical protein
VSSDLPKVSGNAVNAAEFEGTDVAVLAPVQGVAGEVLIEDLLALGPPR